MKLDEISEVDKVELYSLVDNSADFQSMTGSDLVQPFRQWTLKHYGKEWTRNHLELPVAEHGFSMLVRVTKDKQTHTILFDTGISRKGVVENAARIGLNLKETEAVVLSHGHYNHFGGLEAAVKEISKPNLSIIVHENMFDVRGQSSSDGTIREYPRFPAETRLSKAQLIFTKKTSLLANGAICITGEIPRKTTFEKGFTRHKVLVNGSWESDPFIRDDRAIVVNIKRKGLLVISGCAHAGIVNTVTYAQKITGENKIYAVIGGFHLAGKDNEPRIKPTINELKKLNPTLIAPSHCTGWKAILTIAKEMSNVFTWNSIGNQYIL